MPDRRFRIVESGISDTQLYKAAGDAVTAPVIYEIAKNIISEWEKEGSNGNKEESRRED